MEAHLQLITSERPATGRFTFADTPLLTRALRRGDEEAFRWLHLQWNTRLFRYSFAIAAGDEVLAGEIAQATYLRILRHVGDLPSEEALWNWIARAASSAATDLYRKRSRYSGALARFTDWCGSLFPPTGGEFAVAADNNLIAALDAAIMKLADDEKELLEGRYFGQVPLATMAAEQQTTVRAIEGRLARLRTRLKKSIQSELQAMEHSP